MNIVLIAPLYGNGGIASWTKKFLKTFPNEIYNVFPISVVRKPKKKYTSLLGRIIDGTMDMCYILNELRRVVKSNKIDVLHITTSASWGTYRDKMVAKFCHKHNIRCILHYRYGNLPNDLNVEGRQKNLLLETMALYDNIWVLDKKTLNVLSFYPELVNKVRLTPNSIEVPEMNNLPPKSFKKYLFMANIYPTKGIFEIIKAVKNIKTDIVLNIVGPATDSIVEQMKIESGNLWGNKIVYLGSLPNESAVNLLKSMDCLVLPSYYMGEAFPMSILEAMSYGKLVISTPRAAIPDMLTSLDGDRCGLIVDERSVTQLSDAIDWCLSNNQEADVLCMKAYEKVKKCYSTGVVYEMYRELYNNLVK